MHSKYLKWSVALYKCKTIILIFKTQQKPTLNPGQRKSIPFNSILFLAALYFADFDDDILCGTLDRS